MVVGKKDREKVENRRLEYEKVKNKIERELEAEQQVEMVYREEE